MYPINMTPELFVTTVRDIFTMFMVRAGWGYVNAVLEFQILENAGLDFSSAMSPKDREQLYFQAFRKGATVKMNRKSRRILMYTVENSINHAVYSDQIHDPADIT